MDANESREITEFNLLIQKVTDTISSAIENLQTKAMYNLADNEIYLGNDVVSFLSDRDYYSYLLNGNQLGIDIPEFRIKDQRIKNLWGVVMYEISSARREGLFNVNVRLSPQDIDILDDVIDGLENIDFKVSQSNTNVISVSWEND